MAFPNKFTTVIKVYVIWHTDVVKNTAVLYFLFRIFYRVIETGRTYYNINIQSTTSVPKKYLFDTGGPGEYRAICPIFHRLK